MVEVTGFGTEERAAIAAVRSRFLVDGMALTGLVRIERAHMPGYNGLVVPRAEDGGVAMTVKLATAAPFTVAHELAHVADIAARPGDSLLHAGGGQPVRWHVAHRMGAEYFANRVASAYAPDGEVLGAFQHDTAGLVGAARRQDWAGTLVYFALMLGIVHAHGRHDVDPLRLVPLPLPPLPQAVRAAMAAFRADAAGFYDGHAARPRGTAAA